MASLLAACSGPPRPVVRAPTVRPAGVAGPLPDRPSFRPGDAYAFDDGREEQVLSVSGDAVNWTDGRDFYFTTRQDILLPRLAWSTADVQGLRQLGPITGALWPLAVGNEESFPATRAETLSDGVAAPPIDEFWRCSIQDRQLLDTKAGEFEVWRVVCDYSDRLDGREEAGRRVFYYAPAIGYYVRRDDIAADQTARIIELVDFRSANPALPLAAQRVRAATLQATLETKPSGTEVAWTSRTDAADGRVAAIRTFRASATGFCRDYEERIDWRGRQYRVLATACRDKRGRWQAARDSDEPSTSTTTTLAARPGG